MFIIGLIASLPYVGPPTVQKHPNTRYLHSSSFAYPFPDVAALMDLVCTSADLPLFVPLSRPHPVLQIFLPRSFWPSSASLAFLFPSSINLFSVWCLCMCQKQLNLCFSIKFRCVPDVTPSSSAMDWFVLSTFHDNHNVFL